MGPYEIVCLDPDETRLEVGLHCLVGLHSHLLRRLIPSPLFKLLAFNLQRWLAFSRSRFPIYWALSHQRFELSGREHLLELHPFPALLGDHLLCPSSSFFCRTSLKAERPSTHPNILILSITSSNTSALDRLSSTSQNHVGSNCFINRARNTAHTTNCIHLNCVPW